MRLFDAVLVRQAVNVNGINRIALTELDVRNSLWNTVPLSELVMDKIEQAVETYLAKLSRLRSTGGATAETSFYSALEDLLNAIGHDLKPKVFCLSQLADQGAGHPDFGLFTAAQCQRGQPRPGVVPERGVIEVKPL